MSPAHTHKPEERHGRKRIVKEITVRKNYSSIILHLLFINQPPGIIYLLLTRQLKKELRYWSCLYKKKGRFATTPDQREVDGCSTIL